jgi:IclR family acetate operon transcriptional repressor
MTVATRSGPANAGPTGRTSRNGQLGIEPATEARNSTVDRALRVLEAFLGDETELGVLELSRQLDLDKSVIHRILATLVARRFLEQDPTSRRYRVGLRVWELGQRFISGQLLKDIAEKELASMIANHPYATAFIAELDAGDVVVASTIVGPGPLNITIDPGTRMMAELTTTGRTMLAQLDRQTVDKIVTRRRSHYTGRTLASLEDLHADLETIRERGYGISSGLYTPGVTTVARVARSGPDDPLLSLSVDFLVGAETEGLGDVIPDELLRCVNEIERIFHAAPTGTID